MDARIGHDRQARGVVVAVADRGIEQGALRRRPLHEKPGRRRVAGRPVDAQRPGPETRIGLAARPGRDQRVADLAGDLGLRGILVIGGDQPRVEIRQLEPVGIGPLRIVEEVVEREDLIGRHVLPIAHRPGHADREFAAPLRQVGDQLGEVFGFRQNEVFDPDAGQAPELGDQRQQRFGEGMLFSPMVSDWPSACRQSIFACR
jgi:hypothetical protein